MQSERSLRNQTSDAGRHQGIPFRLSCPSLRSKAVRAGEKPELLAMSALMKPMAASDRMVWFDANRSLAAFGVVLIHCTTDFAGSADRP
jgi:hypothetical protein